MDTFTSVNSKGLEGLRAIAGMHGLGARGSVSAVSVVFAQHARPMAEAVRELAGKSGQFSVSLDPAADSPAESGWIELLANGLTFDCTGLAPGPAEPLAERRYSFGLPANFDFSGSEAVTIMPGPHLMGGAAMFPVVRCLAWLGALLAELDGAQAVIWHSAHSYNAPAYFRHSVLGWIAGGAFPALGLTALLQGPDGGIASEGLALFTGQEVQLAPELVTDRSAGAKVALRIVHWLVENGRIEAPSLLTGPAGELLLLEPQQDQRIIKVSRSS